MAQPVCVVKGNVKGYVTPKGKYGLAFGVLRQGDLISGAWPGSFSGGGMSRRARNILADAGVSSRRAGTLVALRWGTAVPAHLTAALACHAQA